MTAALASPVEAGAERPTVLLVEDEVLIRLLIADELRAAGIYVLEASSADEAAVILESSLPVHILFTDVRMPGRMDGVDLTRLARRRRPDIKIIVASSLRPPGFSGETADVFLGKPYDLRATAREVERLLKLSGLVLQNE
jgi:two-component system, response regulator PdtaR